MLHTYTSANTDAHRARIQLVATFNDLWIGDTATTRAPLPVGTLKRPACNVFVFESKTMRLVFDSVNQRDIRNHLMSWLVHGYKSGNPRQCKKCNTYSIGHSGRSASCLHCAGKLRVKWALRSG